MIEGRKNAAGGVHTPNDTLDKLDSEAVAKTLPIVEHMIRMFDERHMQEE